MGKRLDLRDSSGLEKYGHSGTERAPGGSRPERVGGGWWWRNQVNVGYQSTRKSFQEDWAASDLPKRSVQKRSEDHRLKVMRTVGLLGKTVQDLEMDKEYD